jgi:hypothetical protein
MDKQTVLAFILIGALLILWMYLNAPEPQKQLPQNHTDSTLTADTLSKKKPAVEKPQTHNEITKKEEDASRDSLGYGKFFTMPPKPERIVTLENDLVKMEF